MTKDFRPFMEMSNHEANNNDIKSKKKRFDSVVSDAYIFFLWFGDQILHNIRSAATVSLVNVPLSISLAIAGGGHPSIGITSSFWSGLTSALFGGSEFNIVGPTGALSGTLAAASETFGEEVLPWLSLWAALLSFMIWAFKLVDYLMFIPNSVIHGFTLGVAVIICFGQLDSSLGLRPQHHFDSVPLRAFESIYQIPAGNVSPGAPIYFLVNFVLLFSLLRKYPQVPWAVVLTLAGILVGWLSTQGRLLFNLITLEERYGEVQLQLVAFPKWPSGKYEQLTGASMVSSAGTVAVIAVIETLISARMADVMTKTDHNRQQEVLGLSLANLVGGLNGGVPATAALARTSLNIKSGAKSRVSAILGSLFLLIISAALLPYFKFIPMPTIAAILFVVAYRMVDTEHLRHLYKYDINAFRLSIMTAMLCVVADTMVGLVVGSVVALLFYTKRISRGNAIVQLYKKKDLVARVNITLMDQRALQSQLSKSINDFNERRNARFSGKDQAPGVTGVAARKSEKKGTIPNHLSVLSLAPLSYEAIKYDALEETLDPAALVAEIEASRPNSGSFHFDLPLRKVDVDAEEGEMLGMPSFRDERESLGLTSVDSEQSISKIKMPKSARKHASMVSIAPPKPVKPNPRVLENAHLLVYLIAGQITYVNAAAHIFRTKKMLATGHGNVSIVVIALENVWAIDIDGVDALHEMVELYAAHGVLVAMSGLVRFVVKQALFGHEFFDEMMRLGLVFKEYKLAIDRFYPDNDVEDGPYLKRVHSNNTEHYDSDH